LGQQLTVELFERFQRAGAVRPDLSVDDLTFVFEQVASVRVSDGQRARELRHRYLARFLDALQIRSSAPLPGQRQAGTR
jgi:hypothetical protein